MDIKNFKITATIVDMLKLRLPPAGASRARRTSRAAAGGTEILPLASSLQIPPEGRSGLFMHFFRARTGPGAADASMEFCLLNVLAMSRPIALESQEFALLTHSLNDALLLSVLRFADKVLLLASNQPPPGGGPPISAVLPWGGECRLARVSPNKIDYQRNPQNLKLDSPFEERLEGRLAPPAGIAVARDGSGAKGFFTLRFGGPPPLSFRYSIAAEAAFGLDPPSIPDKARRVELEAVMAELAAKGLERELLRILDPAIRNRRPGPPLDEGAEPPRAPGPRTRKIRRRGL
jgi:hypothetical protein